MRPDEKLQRRGHPPIGADAVSTYSVRLPDDLVKLADEKAAMEDRTRSELIREALMDYLTR